MQQYRDLRTNPDPNEPSFSYEESSFWHDNNKEDVEDEFHRRLAGNQHHHSHRRETGGSGHHGSSHGNSHNSAGGSSFWRSKSATADSGDTAAAAPSTPAFSSVNIRSTPNSKNASGSPTSLLSAALQQEEEEEDESGPASHPPSSAEDSRNQFAERHDSSLSLGSTSSRGGGENNPKSLPKKKKKEQKKKEKDRASERRLKFDAQLSGDIDIGHIVEEETKQQDNNRTQQPSLTPQSSVGSSSNNQYTATLPPVNFQEMRHHTSASLDRSSSDQSNGSLLYCKTPSSGGGHSQYNNSGGGSGGGGVAGMMLTGPKTSSLIFPTGVDSMHEHHHHGDLRGIGTRNGQDSEASNQKKRFKINLRLDQCEATRFPFKKKLMLNNLNLSSSDIPMKDLCGSALGNSLHKLSLAGNRLGSVPAKLVQSFPVLKRLDLSQCELHQLPVEWNLPKLVCLNLSHNRFTDFLEPSMLEGLPELQELNMYANKITEITVPTNPKLLSKLEILDLGYNDVVWLPDELDQLKSLKELKLNHNFLDKVPSRVCDMDLKNIDVSSNPVTEPPIETCERGICSMRRYWHCIRMEEQSKKKALAAVQSKLQRSNKKNYNRFMDVLKKPKAVSAGYRKAVSVGSTPDGSSYSGHLKAAGRPAIPSDSSSHVKSTSSLPEPLNLDVVSELKGDVDILPISEETLDAKPETEANGDISTNRLISLSLDDLPVDEVTVNDTLKVIFVGMAMVGKTSMIKRLIEGRDAIIPTRDERTVGVDIYDWEPKNDKRFEHIDSRIVFQDQQLAKSCGDVDVKFSVWDFAGQHVYHATHELFFSSRALYVLVWDMGATNPATLQQGQRRASTTGEIGAFKLYDSSDEEESSEDETELAVEEEERRADRALEHDIDEKVQFWIDCIQSTAPGAAILPVASFDDAFAATGGEAEARRRCNMLKQRLLKHEERRVKGIKERLQEFHDQNRADDIAAIRLRKLLCSYTRPKLIFGEDEDSVVRVSGTQYTGFGRLTEKIIGIATGRNLGQWRYPIFHGHVGARIPRMRLEVREAVRAMRKDFKVVEWGYFINVLRDHGLKSVEDISDALHFLTNTGELSYFGGVMTGSQQPVNPNRRNTDSTLNVTPTCVQNNQNDERDHDDDPDEEEWTVLSMDDTSITTPSTADGSLTTVEDFMSTGLSQFVFLNPRWLVAAVACILRHDLDREIKETRRLAASGGKRELSRTASFYDAHLNCPVITAEDACLLWQNKRITKKAAERAQEYSNDMTVTPFEFLQLLLIRFGVFVPIDLSIEKALFGGKEYQQLVADTRVRLDEKDDPAYVVVNPDNGDSPKARFFFLPSLLGPCEPSDAWTYKSTDSWKTTLCHSILFPDGVPPGLMERLTASVLSAIYAVSRRSGQEVSTDDAGQKLATCEGRLSVKEVLCWRTAFFLKIGTQVAQSDGTVKESIVEIFTHLAGRESHLCVGSDHMGVGMRRLITSGRGQAGDGGRKIWKGGYLLVCKCIHRAMSEYGGLEFEKQGFCPLCLEKKAISEASSWEFTSIRAAVLNSEPKLRCQHGHEVDTRLVSGPFGALDRPRSEDRDGVVGVPIQDLLPAVVVVGLWDGKERKIKRVGSGFLVDKKRGLIVTAAHTLINIWGDREYPFGANYYGFERGKVVIGVIPRDGESGKDMAVFRYFAQIVAKDPSLDHKVCHVDACVLRITTRMENDVGGDGEGCGDPPEILLLNDQRALKNEALPTLKITEKYEREEQVRIVGYNQGGEGLLEPGEHLNRFVDFAKGYVCMTFLHEEQSGGNKRREHFKPREEIVVICPTIGGHSGGPCVNQQGEVIGILSRADPAENQRCYLVPASRLRALVSRAKKQL